MLCQFLARGAHLDALRREGLRIQSPKGDLHLPRVKATDNPATIGTVDVVFFTVKLYDTDVATRRLPPLLGPDTVVIPFQNEIAIWLGGGNSNASTSKKRTWNSQ